MARDLVGKAVGSYRLGEVLGRGRGKDSTVYAAEHMSSGRKAAVKVYAADFSRDKNAAARLVSEVQKATAVKNAHLVEVLDVGTVEHKGKRHLYVAMELLEGETLAKRLESRAGKALPLAQALQIASDVGAALQAMSRAGGRHGGLSSDSVFLARPGEILVGEMDEPDEVVKVLGLGDARVLAADPEGEAKTGQSDDVKALALLVQEMLGGGEVTGGGAPLLPLRLRNREVPVHVDMALRRALGHAAGGFTSCAALVAALLGQEDVVPSVGVWSTDGLMPPVGGRSNVAVGWVVVGALALAGGGIGLWRHFSQPGPVQVADLAPPKAEPDLLPPPDQGPGQGDQAGAADQMPAPPDMADTVPARARPKRTGPPIPPLRGPADYDPNYKAPAEVKPVEVKPAEVKPEASPLQPETKQPPAEAPARRNRPKRTGPPIPPLRL